MVFSLIFAVALLGSLVVAERLAPRGPSLDAEDEFVKRYQEVIGPYARWLRAVVISGAGPHRRLPGHRPVEQLDPLREQRDPSTPPIPSSTATSPTTCSGCPSSSSWCTGPWSALVVVLLVTALSHYLNGGIRMQGSRAPGASRRQGPPVGHPRPVGPGQGDRLLPGPLQPRHLHQRVRPRGVVHRRACPTAGPGAADPGVAGRRRAADLQHPPPGLGPAHPRGGAVVPRGADGRDHLSGRRPGPQGQPGPELARGALHPAEHRRPPGRPTA